MNDLATLIPSLHRPEALSNMFKRNPQLNNEHSYIGLDFKTMEPNEVRAYMSWKETWASQVKIVNVTNNSKGYASNAREALRKEVAGKYSRYFLTDDNAVFSPKSFYNLLEAHSIEGGIMSGLGAPELWHKDEIKKGNIHKLEDGRKITTFVSYSTVHWILPAELYDEFVYPKDCSNDDVYFALWAITKKGFTQFRSCLEAKYSKKRFVEGGHGTSSQRLEKMALSMAILARDFPTVASHEWMLTRFPFRKIIDKVQGD